MAVLIVNLCVQVCLVGIDIRDGLQSTCIQCGACIDACTHVMKKMRYGKSLIGYVQKQVAGVGSRSKKTLKPSVMELLVSYRFQS